MKRDEALKLAEKFKEFESPRFVEIFGDELTGGWCVRLTARNITTQQIEWAIEKGGTPSVIGGFLTWM